MCFIAILPIVLIIGWLIFLALKNNSNAFNQTNNYTLVDKYFYWDKTCTLYPTEKKYKKDIHFHIDLSLKSMDKLNEQWIFRIYRTHGIIYDGCFKKDIVVKDLCFYSSGIMANEYEILCFELYDTRNKTLYQWEEKRRYPLHKIENIYLTLANKNGDLKIRYHKWNFLQPYYERLLW